MVPGPKHLHIADVLTAVPAQIGVDAGMVVLTEDDEPFRSLRIIIGPTEAGAVKAGWHGAVPGRPSTWDLFVSTVAILGGRIDRVVITAVQEERHYFAHIEIEQAGDRRILACRPSDAIALAVRSYNAEILAESDVLDAAGVLPDGTKPGRAASDEAGGSATVPGLAEREAALAEREAALAARELALTEAAERTLAAAERTQAEAAEPIAPANEPVRAKSDHDETPAAPADEPVRAKSDHDATPAEVAPADVAPADVTPADATPADAAPAGPASERSAAPSRQDPGAAGPATGLPVSPG